MKLLSRIFGSKKAESIEKTKVAFFRGKYHDIQDSYEQFITLNYRATVISTAITKDYEKYGYTETFVFIVTYKH
jgi:hypothetical protein